MNSIVSLIILAMLVALIDLPYLYLMSNKYTSITKSISGEGFTNRYYSAVLVYIAIGTGLYFLVLPLVKLANSNGNSNSKTTTNKLQNAFLYGAIFGLSSYAIFDFTTHFMFSKWDLMTSIIDCIWGGVLCGLATVIFSMLVM